MQVLSKPRKEWEDNLHHYRYHIHIQKELYMQKLKFCLCNNLPDMQDTVCRTTQKTILEHFQGQYANTKRVLKTPEHTSGHTSNAHINQIGGNTNGLHFAQTTHKGTKDFKIQVLAFIPLPQKCQWAPKRHLLKKTFWIHRLRCSAPPDWTLWSNNMATTPSSTGIKV